MALFVGRLALDCRPRDLEDLFYKYGKLTRCDVKRGYGFVEYEDKRDAQDALRDLDGVSVLGTRIAIEWAKGAKRTGTNDTDTCFRCGEEGHWARDCKNPASDRGGRGGDRDRGRDSFRDRDGGRDSYRARSPPRRYGRSRSRSPPPARDRSPVSRSDRGDRSYPDRDRDRDSSRRGVKRSRSRSPVARERSRDREAVRRSRSGSPVAKKQRSPAPASRSRSPSPAAPRDRSRSRSRSPAPRSPAPRSPAPSADSGRDGADAPADD